MCLITLKLYKSIDTGAVDRCAEVFDDDLCYWSFSNTNFHQLYGEKFGKSLWSRPRLLLYWDLGTFFSVSWYRLSATLLIIHRLDVVYPSMAMGTQWQFSNKPLSNPKSIHIFIIRSRLRSHFMMISWHGNAFHVTGPLWGESTGPWSIPLTNGPIMQGFDVCIGARLNKLLNIQLNCQWSEVPNIFWNPTQISLIHQKIWPVFTHSRHFKRSFI